MKRLTFITICFMTCMLVIGCANDQYAVEKRYWYLQKQVQKIFKNPVASPPRELEKVVGLLNAFINKFPKSQLVNRAEFDIANLYIIKEEYEKAQVHLKTMLNKYSKSQAIYSEIIYMIGYTYEKEDKWDNALEQYKKIIEDYPISSRGLTMPINIAKHYKTKYEPDKSINAYKEAIVHYRTLIDKYPDSPLAYSANLLVAECYMSIKDWQGAINIFDTMLESYKGKVNLEEVMLNKAMVYMNELKDNAKAKEVLENFIRDYPRSRYFKIAEGLLKRLGKQ